jgi:hypothetical protein
VESPCIVMLTLYIICFPFILQTAFDNVPLIGQYYIIKSIAKYSHAVKMI